MRRVTWYSLFCININDWKRGCMQVEESKAGWIGKLRKFMSDATASPLENEL